MATVQIATKLFDRVLTLNHSVRAVRILEAHENSEGMVLLSES